MKLELREITPHLKELHTDKGIILGTFERDVDGYFYFWRNEKLTVCDSSYVLRGIADKLDEVNKEWNERLISIFSPTKN